MSTNSTSMPLPSAIGRSSAPSATPLCFVIDEEHSIRHFLSLILQGAGIDAVEFANGGALSSAFPSRPPDLIFLNIGADTNDAIQTLHALGKMRYAGAIQLMSDRGLAVLDQVQQVGVLHHLQMLRVLKKPFEAAAVRKILQDLKLGDPPPTAARVRLDDALKNGWLEFWYQPKINLRKKQLAGIEAFARVRHPQYGVLPPSAFMPGADEPTLLALAERTLANVLETGLKLSRLGIHLPIAINMNMSTLVNVPACEIVRSYHPHANKWPGLIIDVTEEQIVTNIAHAGDVANLLLHYNIKLAIDDFGRGISALMKVKHIPFAEMKLDRVFVTGCGSNPANAPICKSVIDLAHSFGALAVGIGIETAADAMALAKMNCDLGQGFLLGQPMAEERFLSLVKQRAAPHAQAAAQPAPQR